MAAAQLPPLLRLALGSPTGMMEDDADSDTEHAHERLDQRAHRKFPKLMPKPLVPGLATLPSEMVGMIITAAAMSARESALPARTMCEWMKAFCRAAGNQDQKCQDVWYWYALAAFGLSTERSDAEGAEPALPDRSGFGSWRALFGGLCEAAYGPRSKDNSDFLRTKIFFHYTPAHLLHDGHLRAMTTSEEHFMIIFDPEMTQRQLDTLNVALLIAKAQTDLHYNRPQTMMGGHTVREIKKLAEQQMFRNWDEWFADRASPLRDDTSPWMAMVTLTTLRGAKTSELRPYFEADRDFYNAVHTLFEDSYVAPTRYAIRDPEALARAMEAMRDARARGANVNAISPGVPFDNLLTMGIKLRNEELLAYLLDFGVHQDERVFELLDIVRFHAFHYESTPWVFSRATTRKLVGALRYLLKLPNRNQDDVRRFQAELWRDLVMYMGYEHVPNWLRAEFAVLRAGSL